MGGPVFMAFIVCCWPGSLGTSSLPGFCNKAIRALQEGVVGFRVWGGLGFGFNVGLRA